MTPQQKAAITRKHNKHKSVLNNLQDFARVIVNSNTAKKIDADSMRVKTKTGKVALFIHKEKDQRVKVKRGRVIKESQQYREEVYPGGWNFFDNAQKVFKKKLKRNEYITVKIGDHQAFNRSFKDINSLLNYMAAWTPKDKKTAKGRARLKEELISHISIVKVKNAHLSVYDDMDDFEDEE